MLMCIIQWFICVYELSVSNDNGNNNDNSDNDNISKTTLN